MLPPGDKTMRSNAAAHGAAGILEVSNITTSTGVEGPVSPPVDTGTNGGAIRIGTTGNLGVGACEVDLAT